MKKFLTPLFLLSLLAAVFTGCGGSATTMVGLQVELTGINHAPNGRTQVTWRLVNPNIVPYLVAQANHRVYLDGVLIGTVNDREALAVPAQSKPKRSSELKVAGPAAERALTAAAEHRPPVSVASSRGKK